ncbi:MAG: helix-turn-helix domain-containing protein [Rhodobiaceae bacterium]|nr:helix-turn-helix domain-containing protein [Rhodobiaceae bacterium]
MKHLPSDQKRALYASIPNAAKLLGIKEHALRRTVNRGLIPFYTPFGSRRYVQLDEVHAFIQAHRCLGGVS